MRLVRWADSSAKRQSKVVSTTFHPPGLHDLSREIITIFWTVNGTYEVSHKQKDREEGSYTVLL
jgi:hypothetical protein